MAVFPCCLVMQRYALPPVPPREFPTRRCPLCPPRDGHLRRRRDEVLALHGKFSRPIPAGRVKSRAFGGKVWGYGGKLPLRVTVLAQAGVVLAQKKRIGVVVPIQNLLVRGRAVVRSLPPPWACLPRWRTVFPPFRQYGHGTCRCRGSTSMARAATCSSPCSRNWSSRGDSRPCTPC